MKKSAVFGLVRAAVMLLPTAGWAEVVYGRVLEVKPQDRWLRVERSGPRPVEVQITVPPEAQFAGVATLEQLQVGDEILVSGEFRGRFLEARTVDAQILPVPLPGGMAETGQYEMELQPAGLTWQDKLARGFTNAVTFPLEIPRAINNQSYEAGPASGWTGGLLAGIVLGVVRLGTGIYEVVTAPLSWPSGYRAVLQPEYVWEDWKG